MTAADLVSDLTQLLYVAAFVGTIVELARRRRRASVDAALFFGVLAAIVVTAQSLRYLQVSLSPVATTVLVAMLLALPYALLRLADDYRGVPRWTSAAAIAGVVLSIALYLAVPPPYPAAMTLAIAASFVAVLVYCAVVFGRGALASAGTTRSRMRAVAIGTGLLALTIVVSILLAVLVGFEAGTLRRFTLSRRGWRNVGIVVGDDLESAERRFFDAWVYKTSVEKAHPGPALSES